MAGEIGVFVAVFPFFWGGGGGAGARKEPPTSQLLAATLQTFHLTHLRILLSPTPSSHLTLVSVPLTFEYHSQDKTGESLGARGGGGRSAKIKPV